MKKFVERFMWEKVNVMAVVSLLLVCLLVVLTKQHIEDLGIVSIVVLVFIVCGAIGVSIWVLKDAEKEIINDYKFKQEIAKTFLFEANNDNDNEYNTIVNKFNNSVIEKIQDATWVSWIMKEQLKKELRQTNEELYQLERNRKNHEFLMQFYA